MKTININALAATRIILGKQGENQATKIAFRVAPFLAMWPNATVALAVQPPHGDAYPATVTVENGVAAWVISSADTAYAGDGKCELRILDGEVVKKSVTFPTCIIQSFTAAGTAPDPVEDWIEDAEAKLGEVESATEAANAAAEAIDNLSVAASGLAAGENPTAVISDVNGHKHIAFGIPKGDKGDTGVSPAITVSEIIGGHRLTITDASHPDGQTVDIMDGDDGRSIVSVEKTATSGLVDTYTITYTSGNSMTFTVTNGYSPIATVSKSGDTATITITDKNGMTSAQVIDGATGATPAFSIGTVMTGAAGSSAAATITGTAEAPVLNFTIPQGVKGDAGNGDMLAPNYSDLTPPILVGQHCIHNGGYYECTTKITTAEAWTEAHWKQVTVGGETSELKSAINDITGNTPIEMTTGAYYPLNGTSITIGSPTSYATEKYALVPCVEGDVFTVSGTGGNIAHPWGFVKSTGEIISTSGGTTLENAVITAPPDSAYLVLNNQISNDGVSYYGEKANIVLSALQSKITKVFDFDYANAITISATQESPVDSWDYTTPGNYKITTSTIAGNVAHLPVRVGGRLFVFETSGSQRLCHLYIANVQAGYQWYIRSKHTSSAWTDWYLLNNPELADALANEGDAWN